MPDSAQGRFEPNYESGHAERRRIARADGMPLCVAGIWEDARHRDGRVPWSFSVLTINADNHPLMRRFHKPGKEKRCVVVVPPAYYQDRLYADVRQARALLRPWAVKEFTARSAPRPARRPASGLTRANQGAACTEGTPVQLRPHHSTAFVSPAGSREKPLKE